MTARRRRGTDPLAATSGPSTVLRWRLILQAALLFVFGAFLAVALTHGGGLNIIVGIFGVLAAIGGAIDAIYGHKYESGLLRQIANHSYRASYAEAELAQMRRLRTNRGPM